MLLARSRLPRLAVAIGGAALLAGVAMPANSRADTSSTLTIVGTSDVVDSNLMAGVITPDFEKAYPQYTLNYVSQGTGAAIASAEAGTASALLVHAASLENQFVGQGYSEEQYGRALFYGDYVLLGPASDPAGVLTHAPHDIATAFERIAAAGQAGTANFVSRGGTPGTTVEEHAIWALTAGVTTCNVSQTNGLGTSPSTTTGACPATISYPSWYHATGLTQGPNVVNADVCNYANGNCYVLTDRGTYEYLESTGAISRLRVVTNNNLATARGGRTLLINSFHGYAINPAKFYNQPNVHLNLTAAETFLAWVTSPAEQAKIGAYMAGPTSNPPFKPDAAPHLTAVASPRHLVKGARLTVSGQLTNLVPGTPPLAGVQVTLVATVAGRPAHVIDRITTGAKGKYTFHYRPQQTASYTVRSAAVSQVENPTLRPIFGDLLRGTSTAAGRVVAHRATKVAIQHR